MAKILLGALGFVIVFSTIVGGMVAAGICHDLLTRDIDILYTVWLWIFGIPFFWILSRTGAADRLERPVAAYLWLLPLMLVWSGLMEVIFAMRERLGDASWWPTLLLVIAIALFAIVIPRLADVFARKRPPPTE